VLLAHPYVKVNLRTDELELLQHSDVDPNVRDKEGRMALHQASEGTRSRW
jgi:hypothetical protein